MKLTPDNLMEGSDLITTVSHFEFLKDQFKPHPKLKQRDSL